MKKIAILTLLITATSLCFGQMKKANQAFEHHHYEEAIELYNVVIRKDLDNDEAITNLAVSYWKTEQYSLAEYWFTRAALMNDDPIVKLWYSQLLISNEKYEQAAKWLTKYAQALTDPAKAKQAEKMASYCEGLSRGLVAEFNCEVFPVSFNSDDLEFAPVLYGDMLLFTSNRPGATERNDEDDPWTHSRFTDVFMTPRLEANNFGPISLFTSDMLTSYHEGPVSFSPDQSTMYLTKTSATDKKRQYDENRNTRLKIVTMSKNPEGRWVFEKDFAYNNKEYNVAHAAVSPDGNTLIFSSDMPGGYGGMDLYACTRNSENNWSLPMNLGEHINTMGNEIFPFLAQDGSLYFSSDLHMGFGGLDLYQSPFNGKDYDAPKNMGAPINGPKDDFSIALDKDGRSGFFSSNRNVSGKDDILFFQYVENILVEGVVIDCTNREPVADATVKLNGTGHYTDLGFTDEEGAFQFRLPLSGTYQIEASANDYSASESCTSFDVVVADRYESGDKVKMTLALTPSQNQNNDKTYICGRISNNRYGNPIKAARIELTNGCDGSTRTVNTDISGTYFIPVVVGCDYTLTASKDNFESFSVELTPKVTPEDCMEFNIALEFGAVEKPPFLEADVVIEEGMILELFHIYFDKNEAEIDEDAIPDLQTLLEILLKNPEMKGEIMAHTDSRASEAYNLELSEKRAKNTMDWLVSHGISADRLTAKGYGESRLKNGCTDGVACSEAQHQRNRRVEFLVTEVDGILDQISLERGEEDE